MNNRMVVQTEKENVVVASYIKNKFDNIKINNGSTDYFIAWDIETSTVQPDPVEGVEQDKVQVVYLSNIKCMALDTKEVLFSVFHRHMEDFVKFLPLLRLAINGGEEDIFIYSHNLNYEMTFLLKETKFNTVFNEYKYSDFGIAESESIFRSKNAPLQVKLDGLEGVVFKDSLALFGKSVAKLGEELGVPKLDYDYKVCRLPHEQLQEEDYIYNENDNDIVLLSLIDYANKRGMRTNDIPLTFTAQTKLDRYEYVKECGENDNKDYLNTLNTNRMSVIQDYMFYNMSLKCYQGGYTSGNANCINVLRRNVYSADIKSSYPYQMCSRIFPKFYKHTSQFFGSDEDKADKLFKEMFSKRTHEQIRKETPFKGYIAQIEIKGLKIKNEKYMYPLSHSQFEECEGGTVINGKVKSMDWCLLMVNEVKMEVIDLCYDYESIFVHKMFTTTEGSKLHETEIGFLLKNFTIKENIDKDQYPTDYAISKANVNNMYGVKVQKLIRDNVLIVDGEVLLVEFDKIECEKHKDKNELVKLIDKKKEDVYNSFIRKQEKNFKKKGKHSRNFDIFQDGVYITDYARLMVIQMMVDLVKEGFNVHYIDTDSVKFSKDSNKESKKVIKLDLQQYINYNISNLKTENDIKVTEMFAKINKKIINNNSKSTRFKQFKKRENLTDQEFNKIVKLGMWEIESTVKKDGIEYLQPYEYFKTLGAKKYTHTENGKIKTTVAGCSKGVGKILDKSLQIYDVEVDELLRIVFTTGTLFDETSSGRTVAKTETREQDETKALTHNGINLRTSGGIIIEDTTYLLNISKSDADILQAQEGYEKEYNIRVNSKGEIFKVTRNEQGLITKTVELFNRRG